MSEKKMNFGSGSFKGHEKNREKVLNLEGDYWRKGRF